MLNGWDPSRAPLLCWRRYLAVALMAGIVLITSACFSGPPPSLYLLQPAASAKTVDNAAEVSVGPLGITQVILPGYASDARVASLADDGSIIQLDRQRWAEDPEIALGRLFAQRLKERSDSSVLIEPWPRDYGPVARIELIFDQLFRQSDGGAHMSGNILLLSGDGRQLVQSLPFNETVAGSTQDGSEFFKAVAIIVDSLTVDTIQALVASETAS